MDYLKAFVIGGAICMLGQVLIDLNAADAGADPGVLRGAGRDPRRGRGV